jgi:hypothetical protein
VNRDQDHVDFAALLLSRLHSALSRAVWGRHVVCGMTPCFKFFMCVMLPKTACVLLRIKFTALCTCSPLDMFSRLTDV